MMKRWKTKHLVAGHDAQVAGMVLRTMKWLMMKRWQTKHLVAEQDAQATGMVPVTATNGENTRAGRMDQQAAATTRQRKMRMTTPLISAIFCLEHLVHIGNTGAGALIPVNMAAMTTTKG